MEVHKEMPRYTCHKQVWALKIGTLKSNQYGDGGLLLVPSDLSYASIKLDADYVRKHDPKEGGYYVIYADGYKSYSPAKAFEEGYTLCK